ncbi:WAT1-related protein [Glycine soja]
MSMILVQVFVYALQLLSRVILVHDSFIFSLIAYRHIVDTICIAPFALYFERMTLTKELFYYGPRDTFATYSVNFLNLVPIYTFFTSIISRLEKLGLHTWAGRAKCGGIILCIGGALAIGIYKGKEFYLGHHSHHVQIVVSTRNSHVLGHFLFYLQLLLIHSLVQLLKVFPLRYTGTMLACILAAIQGEIIGVCINSSKAAWRLEWNLVTIMYSSLIPGLGISDSSKKSHRCMDDRTIIMKIKRRKKTIKIGIAFNR